MTELFDCPPRIALKLLRCAEIARTQQHRTVDFVGDGEMTIEDWNILRDVWGKPLGLTPFFRYRDNLNR